jgi:tripeptidyl-peptidase-1
LLTAADQFLAKWAPYAVSQNFSTTLVNGGLDNQTDTVDDDVEANLDMQYAASIGFGQKINYYSVCAPVY